MQTQDYIAWLGLGIMGSRMAANLQKAGHSLTVYNRTPGAAVELQAAVNVRVADSPAACADARILITMLSNPEAVRAVATGPGGFLNSSANGSPLWIDCSTVDPETSKAMGQAAAKAGWRFVDAPVAGSREPAAAGELVFLAGGSADDLAEAQPLLDIMGKKTIPAGPIGAGSALKMAINLMLGQSLAAYSEAVALGTALGLNPALTQNVLLNTPVAAPVLGALRSRLESGDHTPHFPLLHMHKDLRLAVDSAAASGLSLDVTAATRDLFARAMRAADAQGDIADFSAAFRVLNPGTGG